MMPNYNSHSEEKYSINYGKYFWMFPNHNKYKKNNFRIPNLNQSSSKNFLIKNINHNNYLSMDYSLLTKLIIKKD
jgi:hypothetical protein